MNDIPPPPDGFEMVAAPAIPPPPSGFEMVKSDNVPGQISLPFIGKPSLIGMAKGIYSGLTLPGDVYAGKVDPLSEEGIQRSGALAGTVALGSTAAPAGALGTGMVRTVPAAKAVVPSAQELKSAGSAGFDAMRAQGLEAKPSVLTDFATQVKSHLENELGLDEILAPKTIATLEKAAKPPPEGAVATGTNLHNLRKKLGNIAGGLDKDEAKAAVIAKGQLDDLINNFPSEGVLKGDPAKYAALLKEANANYGAGERAAAIDKKQVQAELRADATHSGQNVANTIRQRMATIAGEPKYMRGYNPQEIAAVTQIAKGTPVTNTSRYLGKLLGGGGGLGQFAVGATTGHMMAGPGGLAFPLAGIGLTKVANALTMRQAKALSEMLRSRSPEATRQNAINALASALSEKVAGGGILGGLLARNPQGLLPMLSGPPIANSNQ